MPKNKKEFGRASAASLFSSYRHKAKNRGLAFDLTFAEFLELAARDCYLCGGAPAQVVKAQHRNGEFVYNGVDRVDNSKGYVAGNVRACCKTCNQMKLTLSIDELRSHLKKILDWEAQGGASGRGAEIRAGDGRRLGLGAIRPIGAAIFRLLRIALGRACDRKNWPWPILIP